MTNWELPYELRLWFRHLVCRVLDHKPSKTQSYFSKRKLQTWMWQSCLRCGDTLIGVKPPIELRFSEAILDAYTPDYAPDYFKAHEARTSPFIRFIDID